MPPRKRKAGRGYLVLAAITLLSGVGAAVLGYAYIEKRLADQRASLSAEQVRVVEKPELLSVVVMQRDVFRGERLTADDLTVLRVPTEGVTAEQVLGDPRAAVGHIALQNLYAGEWLIHRKLADSETEGDTWNRLLEPGHRAIRVPVDDVTGLLGILQPDDRVDLIAVFPLVDDSVVSRILEQNVNVLAVGQHRHPRPDDENADVAGTTSVTLDVTQSQAERIALALEVGKVRLALRNRTDTGITRNRGARLSELERSAVPTARPARNRHEVQVISGDSISREVVKP